MQLTFDVRRTEAVGVRREDPPLVWECSAGEGSWEEVPLSTRRGEDDTTGGLNNERGRLILYLPMAMRPDQVHGRMAYWVRCRLEPRREGQGMYTQSPRILAIAAHARGGTAMATHAVIIPQEVVGYSDGEPGQIFHLQYAPVLSLRPGETIEIEEKRDGEIVFVPWERVMDFSKSNRYDRHFTLDEATGEVCFGPSIRQPDGTMRQYGRVPEARRAIRMSQYRHGGGVVGNVPVGKLQVLRSAIPYIDRVTNMRRASGGRDQESLDEAKLRAQREVRAQRRAVTADDFETLAKEASRAVARAKCNTAGRDTPGGKGVPPGMVDLLIVPSAFDALRAGDLSKLALDDALRTTVRTHLDGYRLLTSTINIREPSYIGIKVRAEIVPSEYHLPETVVARVAELVKLFISPLAIQTEDERLAELLGPGWEGWPFARDLYVSELYSLIQQVPGVRHVLGVQLGQRPLAPSKEVAPDEFLFEDEEELDEEAAAEQEIEMSDQRVLQVPADTLICLLECEVEVVSL